MTLPFLDTLVPAGPDFPIVRDVDLEGGFVVVADDTARNNISLSRQKTGMRVHVQSTDRTFKLVTAPAAPPLSDSNFDEIGGIEYIQFGEGVQASADSGLNECAVTTTGGLGLQIDTGVFFNYAGKRVVVSAPVAGNAPGSDGEYIVYYNSGTESFGFDETSLTRDDFPFAVIEVTGGGGTASIIQDVRRRCAGSGFDKHTLTVGTFTGGGRGAMFDDLRKAVYYAACWNSSFDNEPIEFRLTEQITTNVVDATEPFLAARIGNRLDGCTFRGMPTQGSSNQTPIGWSAAAPLIDFGTSAAWSNVTFENINPFYSGSTAGSGASNPDICLFKNPGSGLKVRNCTINGQSRMSHVIRWTSAERFGGFRAQLREFNTIIEGTLILNIAPNFSGTSRKISAFSIEGDMSDGGRAGVFIIRDSYIHSVNSMQHLVDIQHANTKVHIFVENSQIEVAGNSLIKNEAATNRYFYDQKVVFQNSIIRKAGNANTWIRASAAPNELSREVAFIGCQFQDSFWFWGSHLALGCEIGRGDDGVTNNVDIRGHHLTHFVSCDFQGSHSTAPAGGFHGDFASMTSCSLALLDFQLTGTVSSSGVTVTGSGTLFEDELEDGGVALGDFIMSYNATQSSRQLRQVDDITSQTSLTTDSAFAPALAASTRLYRVSCLHAYDDVNTGPRVMLGCTVSKNLAGGSDAMCASRVIAGEDPMMFGFSEFYFNTSIVSGPAVEPMVQTLVSTKLFRCRFGKGANDVGESRNMRYFEGNATMIGCDWEDTDYSASVYAITTGGVYIGNSFNCGTTSGQLVLNGGFANSVVFMANSVSGVRDGSIVGGNIDDALVIGNQISNLNTSSNNTQKGISLSGDRIIVIGNKCINLLATPGTSPANYSMGVTLSGTHSLGSYSAGLIGFNVGFQNGTGNAFSNSHNNAALGSKAAVSADTGGINLLI